VDWRIVRAMKQPNYRIALNLTRICGAWSLLAALPLAAQSPTPAPAAAAAPAPAAPTPAPPADTSKEHTSYLFGLTFGEQMHSVGISDQVSPDDIERGVKEGLQGKKSTRADQQQIQEFVHSIMVATAAHNKTAAQEFLERNGKEKNVKTTASGLQYKVLVPGDAKAPAVTPTDEVSVNYRGKLLDGTEFDSSYSRGTPATFRINGVIKGWQEALVLMKPGAKYQLFIPPDLAYGDGPRPGIPAGSLLIFDVELLSVKPSDAPLPGSSSQPPGPPHRPVPPPTAAPAPAPTPAPN
jgi:FKBP-type peptidyl-prolyl cis-trans isomerase